MSNTPANPPVIHHSVHSRFEVVINNTQAFLNYTLADGRMTITHTFVPPELRGQNIAGQLAKAAFDYARTEGFKVVPQCSYIAVYASRHAEAKALLER
jgi:predicted GNAT family acetyltransferase